MCAAGWTVTLICLTTLEIGQAILAVQRVRAESELRELWNEDVDGREGRWLGEIDDLIARLRDSGAGDPATLSP
jgi:hypothetical protein